MGDFEPQINNNEQYLQFESFEISMIYGFIVRDEAVSNVINNEEYTADVDIGWSPTYIVKSPENRVLRYMLPINSASITVEGTNDLWPSRSNAKKTRSIERRMTIREDGAGALTLHFKFSKNGDQLYNVSDVLEVMMSLPRYAEEAPHDGLTQMSIEYNLDDVEDYFHSGQIEHYRSKSLPFQLFVSTIAEVFGPDSWDEVHFNRPQSNDSGHSLEAPPMYDDFNQVSDPQIPYLYVSGAMPFEQYENSFLEKGREVSREYENRKHYTREIQALLGRWINEHNIPFASSEYWNEQGVLCDGRVVSKYMNSLVFVAMSGLCTLSLYPNVTDGQVGRLGQRYNPDRMLKPIEVTHKSIRRCLEFSRVRWHHAIWLNREIDYLISLITNPEYGTSDFVDLLNRYASLQGTSALHLKDPNSYLWDASVGSHIASFIHQRVIEDIESEIADKLNSARDVLDSELDIRRTKDFVHKITQVSEDS